MANNRRIRKNPKSIDREKMKPPADFGELYSLLMETHEEIETRLELMGVDTESEELQECVEMIKQANLEDALKTILQKLLQAHAQQVSINRRLDKTVRLMSKTYIQDRFQDTEVGNQIDAMDIALNAMYENEDSARKKVRKQAIDRIKAKKERKNL